MARSRLCRTCGGFHDLAQSWPNDCVGHFGIVGDAAPAIRSDGMEPTLNPVDNRTYDSKSAYYRAVDRAGCHIVEPGSVRPRRESSGPPVADSMRRAFQQLSNR